MPYKMSIQKKSTRNIPNVIHTEKRTFCNGERKENENNERFLNRL